MADRIAAILRQMLQAVGWIAADIAGLDLASFVGDRRARQLVERNLEVRVATGGGEPGSPPTR